MTGLDDIRARYRAQRSTRKANRLRQAAADRRARTLIARSEAGETHAQIAESLGIDRSAVSKAIRKYWARNPHKRKEHTT